jgi:hypothetical protein
MQAYARPYICLHLPAAMIETPRPMQLQRKVWSSHDH